jgi:hypothetical protein
MPFVHVVLAQGMTRTSRVAKCLHDVRRLQHKAASSSSAAAAVATPVAAVAAGMSTDSIGTGDSLILLMG